MEDAARNDDVCAEDIHDHNDDYDGAEDLDYDGAGGVVVFAW